MRLSSSLAVGVVGAGLVGGVLVSTAAQANVATPGVQTAAARYNWGNPIRSDNFNGTKVSSAWGLYQSSGKKPGPEKTKRDPRQIKVHNGILTITGKPNGTSGGMAWLTGHQKYGRWETRVRMTRGCGCYHPVLLAEGLGRTDMPEVDYMEVDHSANRSNADFHLHYSKADHQISANVKADLTKWHTFAVEVAPGHVSGYLDGKRWFYTTRKAAIPNVAIGATIQLDWFPADGSGSGATMQVDWIRMYKI